MQLSAADKLLIHDYFSGKPVKKAYLFGSYARKEATGSSDIDIMVELDHTKPIGFDFFTYQIELRKLLKKKIDLVTIKGLSKYAKPYVDQDKILIYERGK